jgi:hypothetical protein
LLKEWRKIFKKISPKTPPIFVAFEMCLFEKNSRKQTFQLISNSLSD